MYKTKILHFNTVFSRRPYDIFQVAEREFEENDAFFKEVMKVVRLVMYVFLFTKMIKFLHFTK